MSRPRIHRDELEKQIIDAIRIYGGDLMAYKDNHALEPGRAIHNHASAISDAILWRLEKHYTVVRKAKTERTATE